MNRAAATPLNTERHDFEIEGPDVFPLFKAVGLSSRDAKAIECWVRRWRWFPRFPKRRRQWQFGRNNDMEVLKVRIEVEDFDLYHMSISASPSTIARIRTACERMFEGR